MAFESVSGRSYKTEHKKNSLVQPITGRHDTKYVSKICKLVSAIVIAAYMIAIIIIFIGMTHYTQWMPTEGMWYCDELQISLSLDENITSFAIIDGEKVNSISACLSVQSQLHPETSAEFRSDRF